MAVLPDNAQLWLTTHSLGVLRAAQEVENQKPGSVCLIDFDVLDPDVPREIVPSSLDRATWEKMLSIALDDLSPRIAPNIIVVCEGSSIGNRRKDFDAEIYNRILAEKFPGLVFVSGGSSAQIAVHGVSVRQTLEKVLPTTRVIAMCDRDDKSEREVELYEAQGNIVLPRRNLESFLFADDVIEALVKKEGKLELLPRALEIKGNAIAESIGRRNPADDLKSAAGDIYRGLKELLSLQRCGNDKDMFMRDTLAQLIEPNMPTYNDLKIAIVERLIPSSG